MQFQLAVGYTSESATNLELKVWNASTNEILNVNEKFNFQNDGGLGTIAVPIKYTVTSTCDLSVLPESIDFTNIAGNKSATINSNSSWTVSYDASWITVSPTSGNNNGTLTISVSNNSGAERSGIVTVSGCNTTKTITVTQSGTCNLSLSKTNLDFTSSAGNNTVNVTSNSSWTVSDDKSWITVSPASDSNNGTLTISVTANSGSQRSGTVKVSGCSTTKEITVTQSGACSLSLSKTSLDFTSSSGNNTVNVTSNSSWTVSDDATWITVTPTSGSNNGTLTISVSNNSGAERSGIVTVSGCNTTKTITVTQESDCSLSLSANRLDYKISAGNKSVTVTSNSSWTVSDDATWITVTPASGSNNGSLTVSVTANTATEKIGIVTVSCGGVTKKITVIQEAYCTPPWSPTNVSATQTSISPGQTVILSINGGMLNSATEWEWYTGGCGITRIGSGESLTVTPTKTTTYYVQAKACNDSTTCRSVTVTISAVNPTDDFYIQNSSLSTTNAEPGGTVDVYCDQCYTGLKTDSNMGNVFVGYYLSGTPGFNPATAIQLGTDGSSLGTDDLCNSETETLTIPAGTAPGTYYILFVADYSGTFEESDENNNVAYQQIQLKTTAIGNILVQGQIKIYPNPTTGIITIEGLPENKEVDISIFDSNMKFIKKQTSASSVTKLDISDVVSGTYLLIIDDVVNTTFKIIKE
jgi:hypothetical protein